MASITTMQTIVDAVFTFPDHPAAITRPLSEAIILRPLTANSQTLSGEGGPMNLPNKLTMLRIILTPIFLAVLYWGFPGADYAALAIFIIASLTDMLDGKIARKYNLVTDFGKFVVRVIHRRPPDVQGAAVFLVTLHQAFFQIPSCSMAEATPSLRRSTGASGSPPGRSRSRETSSPSASPG